MKLLPLLILLAALCGCNPPPEPGETIFDEPQTPVVPPPVVMVSHAVHFTIVGGNGVWRMSDSPTDITGSGYTRDVTTPLTITFTPAAGTVVSGWMGVGWHSGNTATILPIETERTVTVVLAPQSRG